METKIEEPSEQSISFKALTEEQKEQFFKIINVKSCEYIEKFLKKYEEDIKKELSNASCKTFDKVLKKHEVAPSYLKILINKLPENLQNIFIYYTVAGLFSGSKEIINDIIKKQFFDTNKILKYITDHSETERKNILAIFDAISFDLGISDQALSIAEKDNKITKLEKNLETQKQSTSELEKTYKADKKEWTKKVADKEKEIKDKDEEIKKLTEQVEDLKKLAVKKEVTPTKIEKELTKPNLQNDKLRITLEDALYDIEHRTLLGIVKPDGIQVDKHWVVVTPIIPIINENANINKEELLKELDYRSDYNSFLLFLDDRVLKMVLSEDDAYNYDFYSTDEKFACLFAAFCKKIIFFVPMFEKAKDDERLKLNAYLLRKPIVYTDFNNSTFIPFLDVSKKRFEDMVKGHEDIVLDSYPYSLSSILRYIYVDNSIYEINYIPDALHDDGKNITWKYNEKEINGPFRKLDLKIDNEPSNDYILTPSGLSDEYQDDLYVKNATLTKLSKKTKLLFDEDEFISNVKQNAKFMHLFYKENDLKNFHIAIKSSSLVILAGPSGIGKTKLPLIYANTLGLDMARNTVLFVPISPSYLEPEDVLGYIKPLQNSDKGYNAEFIESQTGLVSFLIDAQEHKDKIHLVVFDEMNLSQIEHWFAPFISLLEQDIDSRVLNLYSNNLSLINGDKFPSTINIGENVIFVGTVNIDETTKHISDRLLDRAIVINLAAPSFTDLRDIGTATTEIYQEVPYSSFASSVAHVDNAALEFLEAEFDFINELNDELIDSIYGKGISFRSLNKIATYLKNSKGILERKDAFDFAIAQMVIQKISGSSDDLKDLLTDNANEGILCILNAYPDVSGFERSKKAILKKVKEIERYGFTR